MFFFFPIHSFPLKNTSDKKLPRAASSSSVPPLSYKHFDRKRAGIPLTCDLPRSAVARRFAPRTPFILAGTLICAIIHARRLPFGWKCDGGERHGSQWECSTAALDTSITTYIYMTEQSIMSLVNRLKTCFVFGLVFM